MGPWLSGDAATSAAAAARGVASRLREPGQVEAAVAAASRQTDYPGTMQWQPDGVAQGYAGLAILFGYLDDLFAGEGWDEVGHRYLGAAARALERDDPPAIGLYSGLSGTAFAGWCLSRGGSRYRRFLSAIDQALLPATFAASRRLRESGGGVPVSDFDAISGLTGVGAYFLCRRSHDRVKACLEDLLETIVRLIGEDGGLPRWHTPADAIFDDTTRRYYPRGNLNCGLAHGLPGPLALMSLASRDAVLVPGMGEAIGRAADWLMRHTIEDSWGINWPAAVPLVEGESRGTTGALAVAPVKTGTSRTAWCYGSPGVARALWLAGEAIGSTDARELALTAMRDVFRRPVESRYIDSPTFCHGIAGLLQVTLRFADDTGLACFKAAAQDLTEQLLSLYRDDSLTGFRSIEPGGKEVDCPGLLDGAAGVALVLLAAASGVTPNWDRLFMLS